MEFNKLKYRKDINQIYFNDAQKITEKNFIDISNNIFKLNANKKAGFKMLNRNKDAIIIKKKSSDRVLFIAEKNNFFKLNGFANYYRKTIKISYCTLRDRINKNKNLKQYLIDNNFIFCFYYKDLKSEDQSYNKENILVNYEKRFEFINLILKAFLNENQRNSEL